MRADQISRFVSGHDFRGCGKGLERATSVRAWLRRRPFSKSVIPSGARNLLCVFDRPRMRREPIPHPLPFDKLRVRGFGMTRRDALRNLVLTQEPTPGSDSNADGGAQKGESPVEFRFRQQGYGAEYD